MPNKGTYKCCISVIVSTYASEEFIDECLQDLSSQTILDCMEIIIVDANSPENEKDIIFNYQKKFENIVYIKTATRINVYEAWNIAIKCSSGKYITPFSTNDRLKKDAYEVMLRALENNDNVALVYGDSYVTDTPHENFYNFTPSVKKEHFVWPAKYSFETLLTKALIGPHPMWRKDVHDDIGYFDERYSAWGDQDFFLRLGEKYDFLHLNEFTGLYWWADNAISNPEYSDIPTKEKKEIRSKYIKRYINRYKKQLNKRTHISVVIPVYNKIELTRQCLNNIFSQKYNYNFEIIIVDNNSTDGTSNFIDSLNEDINYIANQKNIGFAKACNQGAKEATGDYLIFLNNDTIPQKGWLDSLVNFIKNKPNVGVVGCKLLYPDNTVQHCGASMNFRGDFFRHQYKFVDRDHSLVNDIRELDAVTAACFLTPRETFLELGMFDEGYLNGCEDMDYCAKVKKAGLKIYYNPESVLYHLESQTSRPENKDIENFNYYLKKWGYDYIKNEIEVYAEDGFWTNKNGRYVKAENQHIAQFLSELRMARIENDNNKLERFTKIINRIYPIESWEKKNLKKNETKKYYSPKINSESFKILFVCHDFPPHRFAGAQLYAKNLAKELKKEKCHEIEIIYPVVRPPSPQDYSIATKTYEGLTVHELYKPIGSEPEKVFDEKTYEKILSFLQENNFDLIHFHGFGQITLAPIFAAKKLQIPCIATLHDYWLLCDQWHLIDTNRRFCSGPESIDKCAKCFVGQNQPSADQFNDVKKYKNFRQEMTRKAFNLLDACFAPSDFLAQFYGSYGYSGVKKIPIGLSSIPLSNKNSDDDQIHFGFAGQIISRKGADILIQAFRELPASNKACLHIWGGIQEEEYGKAFLSIVKKDSRIQYHGPFEQKDLPGIYDQIHIAVVPSLMENYPLTVLEAFAHKKPVIASKVGGIPEIVTDNQNGLLVPPGDGKALLEAMEKCLNPTFLSSLARNIPEIPTISDDAEKYGQEYNKILHKKNKKRILFYFFKNVHIPIMKPILRKWQALHPESEVAIGYMHYAPEIRAGFEPEELEQIKELSLPMYERPQDFQPDITFIADSVYPWVRGCGKLVHIGHGLLSKGQYYTDTPTARREEEADLVCVPGKHHQKIMRRIISKPVIATGMAKLDPLFSGEISRQTVLKKYGLPGHKKYILFAPTFNDELSAIPHVKEKIADILPEEAVLLIKLHGSTRAEYKEMYRKLPFKNPRVIYVDDLDISPFLALADVLITDVSSTMFEFAALDKPVVLFDSPNWGKYENYNPKDIEFTWRDFALRTNTLEEMGEAVKRSLEQPAEFSGIRTKYTQLLLANQKDGRAAQRIVEAAHSLIQEPAESSSEKHSGKTSLI